MNPSNTSHPSPTKAKQRLLGIDLIRLILIVPMAMMHAWNIFFGEATITVTPEESLYPLYHKISELFLGYAGLLIFSISFFLFGYLNQTHLFRGRRGLFRAFILFCAMLSTQVQWDRSIGDIGFFNWDLFSFILLSFLLISALRRLSETAWNWIGLSSMGLLCVTPFLFTRIFYGTLLPAAENVLVATSSSLGPNGWFLLPWLALPLVGYAWGRFSARINPAASQRVTFVCLILSFASIIAGFFASRLPLKMGSFYYEFLFRQNPIILMQSLIPFLTLLFLFSRPAINERLYNCHLGFIQHLQWSKNFWLAYAMHFGVLDLFTELPFFTEHIRNFDFAWLFALVAVEVLLQMVFKAFKFYAWVFKKTFGRLLKTS